jgi:hypothetical protein
MKSLYNKYEAQTKDCDPIHEIMDEAVKKVVEYCKKNNLSLRDALGVSSMDLTNGFGYHIIFQAHHMKQVEKGLTPP